VLQQSEGIARLLQSLNKLLHANMKLDSELVPLSAELELLHHYVRLMELRYTNRFKVEWQIEENTMKAMVPPMILQPLMENAIFHGSFDVEGPLQIEVSVSFAGNGDELLITIADNGHGIPEDALEVLNGETEQGTAPEKPNRSTSIGVANVRDRIRLRFGPPYTLTLRSRPGQGTLAELYLPYRPEDEETALPRMEE
jgi:two-component system sensor histidine kinase YesM